MSSDISYKVGEATNTIKASDWENNIATAEINLKHDQTIIFTNLPFGVTYDVTETDYTKAKGGYDAPVYTYTNTNQIAPLNGELSLGVNYDPIRPTGIHRAFLFS